MAEVPIEMTQGRGLRHHSPCFTVCSGNPWPVMPSTVVQPPGHCAARGRLSRAHLAHRCMEPLSPCRLLVRAAVRWASAWVTWIIAGLFAWKTASREIPHLQTSRRIHSMLIPVVLHSAWLMHGLERFTCGLRPLGVSPLCVRLGHHRFDTDTLSMRLPALPGDRCLFNRNIM